MKRIIFSLLILISFLTGNAQNPFARYGYKVKVSTMSNGKYDEFHDKDRIVEIGSVRFDTRTNEIVGTVEEDSTIAQLNPHVVSRFVSIDPHAERYYSISPYVYVGNNPIRLTDPNGCDWRDRVVGTFVATVDNATGINLRSTYTPIDASDYNDGQNIGDLASVFIGTGEVDAGGGTASGSVLVTAGTGGLSIEITGPTFALGSAVAGHGAFMVANGASNFASQKGRVSEQDHKMTDKGSLSGTKTAVKEVHDKVGGSLPKGKSGKKGSPQRGDSKKGYRLDPGHPNRAPGDPESGPHINWWDYTKGKRGSGGESGAIPIK